MRELLLFITGVALFLFGMLKLSSGMQLVFTSRMRQYIHFAVSKPFFGLLTGLVSTIVFQSSSATTLLTMGFVSAGLISFYHSLAIILGADIGTTLTIQLIAWKVTAASPVFLFIGVTLYFFGKSHLKTAGEMLIYFGTIFYGLSLIGDATTPLKENQYFLHFLREAQNPFVGFLIGLVFAALVHASAIPIGILVILGQQGLITVGGALPIIIGANVGTTATALLGSIATDINGKRTAVAHLLFKCCSAFLCFLAFPLLIASLQWMAHDVDQQVVYAHFLINVLTAAVFTGILKPFSRMLQRIIPVREDVIELASRFLQPECLTSPREALDCVRDELGREMKLAQRMYNESIGLFDSYRTLKKQDIWYIEPIVDSIQTEITEYLWNISCENLAPALTKRLFAYSSFTSDIERIGDHSTNLTELAEAKHRRKALLSKEAHEEFHEIAGLVRTNLTEAATLIRKRDIQAIGNIFEREKIINAKISSAIAKHSDRSNRKICRAETGPIYVDMLVNLERISDHCKVIARLSDGLQDGDVNPLQPLIKQ